MYVRIWGCRGSIPTPGKSFVEYGGNTSCVEVRLKDQTTVVFDAGSGIRSLGARLMSAPPPYHEITLVLTHAHWDHLLGFPFFAPLFDKRFTIHVRGGPIAKETVHSYLSQTMAPPHFPISLGKIQASINFSSGLPVVREVGDSKLMPIPLNHPNGGYGFRIEEGTSTFCYIPDNELGEHRHAGGKQLADYRRFAEDANLLFHDAQYLPKEANAKAGWGHSSVTDALSLAKSAGVRQMGLFHHDPMRDDESMKKLDEYCRKFSAKHGDEPATFAAKEGMEFSF